MNIGTKMNKNNEYWDYIEQKEIIQPQTDTWH